MNKSTSRLIAIAFATSVATGCTSFSNGPDQAISIQQMHPISVDSQVVTLTLDDAGQDGSLSQVDSARLRAFAGSYLTDGHGPITVTTPSGNGSDAAAREKASMVRKSLYDMGIPYSSISAATYRNGGENNDLILSYTHYVATPSACGLWEGLRGRDQRNLRSPNFGCSAQNNLAAMIGDPRDLVMPADMTDPDAAFRIRGVEAFRTGEAPVSETDGDIETQVSN